MINTHTFIIFCSNSIPYFLYNVGKIQCYCYEVVIPFAYCHFGATVEYALTKFTPNELEYEYN